MLYSRPSSALRAASACDLGGGTNSPERIILVQLRDAEDSHHCVADELLDGATVALEHSRAVSK